MVSFGNKSLGFSLLELLIALAISALLLGLAVPSMQSFVQDSEISATTNRFVHSLQTARSEAIKRAGPVSLCPSSAPAVAQPVCNDGSYANGWFVYFDADGNGSRSAAEEVILQVEITSAGFQFTVDAVFNQRVYFSDSGTSINPAGIPLSGNIRISYAGDNEVRDVAIAANGRISTTDPNA